MPTTFNRILLLFLVAITNVVDTASATAAGFDQHRYPRIMGMNISRPSAYDTLEYQAQLSKPAIVILGFYEGWGKGKKGVSEKDLVSNLKKANPTLLVGQYTILNEWKDESEPSNARQSLSRKLDAENWWLRDAKGDRKQWTAQYRAYDINITEWAKPDASGVRYPEWLVKKDYETFFRTVPEFDIWYFDNALSRSPVKVADWDGDGKDDSRDDPRIAAAYRRGQVAHWEAARRLHPTALFIGNSDDISSSEFSGKLQGIFLEALIGASWSTEAQKGWEAMMARYRMALQHTASPHIIGFNVHGKKADYQRMRYGLASCLLDDGYFSCTDESVVYGSVPWFDEYDVRLGAPIDPPQEQVWSNGVYRRRFERGMVLVNPTVLAKEVTVEAGYRKFSGKQASDINDGSSVEKILLSPKDGLVLVRDARTP